MGLFLQKTNIIRDYLEVRQCPCRVNLPVSSAAPQDIMEEPAPRMFWPKAVWSKCVCLFILAAFFP
jgi:farnesyl-diphosphate farnesyltransferase